VKAEAGEAGGLKIESMSHAQRNVRNCVHSWTDKGLVVMPLSFVVELDLVLRIGLVEGR
jgi:hypothetical protein